MPKPFIFLLLLVVVLLTGCARNTYFVSPYNGNHSVYHPIRMQSDSLQSAWHVHAAVALGGANDQGADEWAAFHTGVSGSHNFGAFQGFYSLNVSAGNYKIEPWGNMTKDHNRFFGGTGFEGGLNVVTSFDKSEWRILGVETSLQYEWGDYLRYREALPHNQVDLLVKSPIYATLGGYTELVTRTGNTIVGFRLAYGTVLGRHYKKRYLFYDNFDYDRLTYRYGNFTVHMGWGKYTGHLSALFATRANGLQLGMNYRLGK